jgi:hypothetical protein
MACSGPCELPEKSIIVPFGDDRAMPGHRVVSWWNHGPYVASLRFVIMRARLDASRLPSAPLRRSLHPAAQRQRRGDPVAVLTRPARAQRAAIIGATRTCARLPLMLRADSRRGRQGRPVQALPARPGRTAYQTARVVTPPQILQSPRGWRPRHEAHSRVTTDPCSGSDSCQRSSERTRRRTLSRLMSRNSKTACPLRNYSQRRATAGSTPAARRAGTYAATPATNMRSTAISVSVTGSVAETP